MRLRDAWPEFYAQSGPSGIGGGPSGSGVVKPLNLDTVTSVVENTVESMLKAATRTAEPSMTKSASALDAFGLKGLKGPKGPTKGQEDPEDAAEEQLAAKTVGAAFEKTSVFKMKAEPMPWLILGIMALVNLVILAGLVSRVRDLESLLRRVTANPI